MINNKDKIGIKTLSFKKYLWYFIRTMLFLLTVLIISNIIRKVELLGSIDIIAVILSSFIIVAIKVLYDKFGK